jgi:hypothetical protein
MKPATPQTEPQPSTWFGKIVTGGSLLAQIEYAMRCLIRLVCHVPRFTSRDIPWLKRITLPRCFVSVLVGVSVLCGGCASIPVSRYRVKEDSSPVIPPTAVKSKLVIADFKVWDPERRSFAGRPFGVIMLPETLNLYVKEAFIAELRKAGIYSPEAANRVKVSVDDVHLKVAGSISKTGSWTIRGTISNETGLLCSAETKYEFRSAWNGDNANANAAEAFPSAVNAFIIAIVSRPDFVRYLESLK